MANFDLNLWENGMRWGKSDLIFWNFRISSNIWISSDFLYFHSFTSKNRLKVNHFCKINILQKWLNFEAIFGGEGVEIEKIWWNCYIRGDSELSEYQIRFSLPHPIYSQINVKLGQFQKILMLSPTKFGPFLISPVLVLRDQFWEK